MVLSGFQNIGIITGYFFQNYATNITDIVSWSEVEVFPTWFQILSSFDIIAMLRQALLKVSGRLPNIFISGMVNTVSFYTFPIIDTVLSLAVNILCNFVSVPIIANHLAGWGKCNGADWALSTPSAAGAPTPTWSSSGCSSRSCCWWWGQLGSTQFYFVVVQAQVHL